MHLLFHILRSHLLTTMIAVPLVAAVLLAAIPRLRDAAARWISFTVTLAVLGLAASLVLRVKGTGEFELAEHAAWIPSLGVAYRVGVDGASAMLIGLTALLSVCAVLSSWREIKARVPLFHALLLATEAALVGVFASLDLFLFFVFWEAALIPMAFLIGIFGSAGRLRAATKFLLMTVAGSAVMLAAILYAGGQVGSFDLIAWYAHRFTLPQQQWLIVAFAIGFAVKLPVLGLHTWLPDAHTEAPTAGSILLAGVFLKMGAYGFLRLALPLFPLGIAWAAPVLLSLAVAGIIAGALLALAQVDLKRLVAYSSISHMGFVLLGLAALERHAAAGAILQMVTHGLITGALFLIVGMLYERRGTRVIADYGGTARSLPLIATAFIFMALASMGLPGLANFASEFLILLGSFQTRTWFAAAAVAGVVLAAVYLVWAIERVFFGPLKHEEERRLPDLRARELGSLGMIALLVLLIGIWPQGALSKIWRSADAFVALSKRVEMITPAVPQAAPPAPPMAEPTVDAPQMLPAPNAEAPDAPARVPQGVIVIQ